MGSQRKFCAAWCIRRRRACAAILGIVLLDSALPGAAPLLAQSLVSPRLNQLAVSVAGGDQEAVERFWQETKRQGTPLVETCAEPSDHLLVSYVWRGEPGLNNVVLAGGVAPGHPADYRLARLADTDVWWLTQPTRHDLRTTYWFSLDDPLVSIDWGDHPAIESRASRLRRDPLNSRQDFAGSLVELPGAAPQPWIRRRPHVPVGTLHASSFTSAVLGNERKISVYRPPGFDPRGGKYPLLIVFDLDAYTLQIPLPTILSNLIADRKIPPVVALLVGNAKDARARELACHEPFVTFLTDELLPRVQREHHATSDPRHVLAAGSSLGGLAAAYLAWQRPDVVGNVLSQSCPFAWSPETAATPHDLAAQGEWLARQIVSAPPQSLRFYLEVGLLESARFETRHLRDVLLAKGYHVAGYHEYHGGHDYVNWRGSIADGLIALWGPANEMAPSAP